MRRHKDRGFTLMEMAIVSLLIGIVLAAMSPLYSHYLRKQKIERTQVVLTQIKSAVGNFRAINGRYPCPASLTLERDDPGYGREDCSDMSGVAPGTQPVDNNGIGIEVSVRPAITFPDPAGGPDITQVPRVRVGFIPFRNLNIDENEAYDGYGSRIMYVVTENLMNNTSFQADGGGIEIVNELDKSTITPPGAAHFMALSYGENEAGAYKRANVQIPCHTRTVSYEGENCIPARLAIYRASQIRTTNDPVTTFDDQLVYFTQYEIPLWQLSNLGGHADDIHQKPGGNVGFVVSPAVEVVQEGEVGGRIRAQDDPGTPEPEGRFQLNKICDEYGEDGPDGNPATNDDRCFEPKAVAGKIVDGGGMECPPGQFARIVGDSQLGCVNEVTIYCPPGQYMVGIQNGTLLCNDPPPPAGCDSEEVTLCGTRTFELEHGYPGQIVTIGDCYGTQKYRCENNTWTPFGPEPACTCKPGGSTSHIPCSPGYECPPGNPDCVTVTVNTQCEPICNVNTTTDDSLCVCTPRSEPRTTSCPDGYTGTGITEERYWTCDPPGWSDWTPISNDCVCGDTRPATYNCPAGTTGGPITFTQTYQCPNGPWLPAIPADTSACIPQVCQWYEGDTSLGVGPIPLGNPSLSQCICGSEEENCHSRTGADYENFLDCYCQ
jgi:prepilin-type N-terminal cleavage/methylation domain-containing protein